MTRYLGSVLFGCAVLAVAASSAEAATCSVAGSTLTIQLAAESAVIREPGGTITVNGAACAATADIDDVIVAGGNLSDEILTLTLQGFAGAASLQWSIDLGTGSDRLIISAAQAGSSIEVGSLASDTHVVDLDDDREADITVTGFDTWRLFGGPGPDRLSGRVRLADGVHLSLRDLRMRGGGGDDVLVGGSGFDRLYGEDGNDILTGVGSPDELHGGPGNDELQGTAGADEIFGGAGDDHLDGRAGHDAIYPGPGNDTAIGGAGDDIFFTESAEPDGDDLLDGGIGEDYVNYATRTEDLTIDLAAGLAGGATESDTLASIEGALAGSGNDTLIGDGGENYLNGLAGDDTLIGGAGFDALWCGPGIDSWSDALDAPRDCENPL